MKIKFNCWTYLYILIAIGFILRVIAAINIGVTADDMHFAPGAINFLSSGKLVYWDQSSALWFAVTDIFYQILGPTQIASRAASILFGTLTIPLIFMLAMLLFKDKSIAYIAAVLVTFSNQHIKSMMAEMDVMAMFFAFFSIYFLYKSYTKEFDKKNIAISGILLGLAIYTKVYPLLFIPGMLLFMYKNKCSTKKLALFCSIIFIFCIPTLTHNYLLFKDKGLMDHQFTRVFGDAQHKAAFSWIAGNNSSFGFITMFNGIIEMSKQLFRADPAVILFGLFGLAYLFYNGYKDKKPQLQLLFCSTILPFLYLCSMMNLIKHYLFVNIVLIFPAAIFIKNNISNSKFSKSVLLITFIIFSMGNLSVVNSNTNFYERSSVSSLMEYKEQNIANNSIVILDSRIYRGQLIWMFSDRHYLESTYLGELFNLPFGPNFDTYFVECKIDDCGWGTISNQPEFNESNEKTVQFFNKPWISTKVFENKNFLVYKTVFYLPKNILWTIDSKHIWWMYPLGYKENILEIFDEYEARGNLDRSLDRLAHMILYISIVLVFISILLLLYYLVRYV